MMKYQHTRSSTSNQVVRNERMTAMVGIVLFIVIIIELVITANLHALIRDHIFVGVLLAGPLVVKMCSTGYRFFRYYSRSPVFLQSGPPNIWLRLLGPLLMFDTILVFVSGIGLAVVGPTHTGLFFKVHAVSVALWLPMVAVHVYAHIRRAVQAIASDLSSRPRERVPGRTRRLGINLFALVGGTVAAILMMPVSAPWNNWHGQSGLPSPLVAGIMASVFAVLIAIPLFRNENKG